MVSLRSHDASSTSRPDTPDGLIIKLPMAVTLAFAMLLAALGPICGYALLAHRISAHTAEEIARTATSLPAWTAVLLGLCLLVIVLVALAVHWKVSRPIRRTALAAIVAADGDLSVRAPEEGKSEVRVLGRAVNKMIGSLQEVVSQADTIAQGNYSADIAPRSDRDALGLALSSMTKTLRDVVAVCERVAEGDYSHEVEVKSDKDMLGRAVNKMIGNLREVAEQINLASAKLTIASREQAEGVRNQSTATAQMSATVTELLTSARQMAESGASVAEQAELAAKECSSGTMSVQKAVGGIKGIQERMGKIAEHMVSLGAKGQQIGSVLDIISELSEQTNLLSLNASIEAAGAGKAGKRFAVVASEIRKLAERAASSTEEIRGLIDGVRETVNSTIMVTEEGTKAVQEGACLTEEVDRSFESIAQQVTSTVQSAKVIEMGNRQQATAIEQMQSAVSSVDSTAQQSEAAARQVDTEAQALLSTARRLKGSHQGQEIT